MPWWLLHTKLPPELADALHAAAAHNRRSVSAEVREALREHLLDLALEGENPAAHCGAPEDRAPMTAAADGPAG